MFRHAEEEILVIGSIRISVHVREPPIFPEKKAHMSHIQHAPHAERRNPGSA